MPPDIPSFNASKLRFGEGGEVNLLLSDSTLGPHKEKPGLGIRKGKPTRKHPSETMRANAFQ